MFRLLRTLGAPLPTYAAAVLMSVLQQLLVDIDGGFVVGDDAARRAGFKELARRLAEAAGEPEEPWTLSMESVQRYWNMLLFDREGCIEAVRQFGLGGFTLVFELAYEAPFLWGLLCVWFVYLALTSLGSLFDQPALARFSEAVTSKFGQLILAAKFIHWLCVHTDLKSTPAERTTEDNRTSWVFVLFGVCWAFNMGNEPLIRVAARRAWTVVTHVAVFSIGVLILQPTVNDAVNTTYQYAGGLNMTCVAKEHDMIDSATVARALMMAYHVVYVNTPTPMAYTLYYNETHWGVWWTSLGPLREAPLETPPETPPGAPLE